MRCILKNDLCFEKLSGDDGLYLAMRTDRYRLFAGRDPVHSLLTFCTLALTGAKSTVFLWAGETKEDVRVTVKLFSPAGPRWERAATLFEVREGERLLGSGGMGILRTAMLRETLMTFADNVPLMLSNSLMLRPNQVSVTAFLGVQSVIWGIEDVQKVVRALSVALENANREAPANDKDDKRKNRFYFDLPECNLKISYLYGGTGGVRITLGRNTVHVSQHDLAAMLVSLQVFLHRAENAHDDHNDKEKPAEEAVSAMSAR